MSALGIDFGLMTVTKTVEKDSSETYTLKAKGYLKVLWMERDDETRNTVRYQNGKLLSSSYTQMESNVTTNWNTVTFDGKNLSSGVYFYKLESDNFSEVKKMSLIK